MQRLLIVLPLLLLGCPRSSSEVPQDVPQVEVKCPPLLTKFVQKSNPGLSKEEAEQIAGVIERVSDQFDLDLILFASIIRHESHFKNGIKACRFINNRRTCDYGIAQVNTFWVDEWELDASRLRNDLDYNITVAARILKGVLDKTKGDKYGYSLYNSANPEHRSAYQSRIERYRELARLLTDSTPSKV